MDTPNQRGTVKTSFAALFLMVLISFSGTAYGQSTLTFSRVIDTTEMSSVGLAIVNPGTATAPIVFTLYGPAGEMVSTASAVIPAGGQLARLASELFPAASEGGWVQGTSVVNGLAGFWLGGDFANVGDGAEAAPAAFDLILPLVTDQSEIILINTVSNDTAVLLRLYGGSGQELAEPAVQFLAAKGSFHGQAKSLFDPIDWSVATHVRVTALALVAGSAMVRNFQASPSLGVTNGVSAATTQRNFALPHVIHGTLGELNYATTIGVTNLVDAPQEITLSFVPAGGGTPRSVQRTLPPNGGVRASARSLFGFTGEFETGWVTVSGPQALIGFEANAELNRGSVSITGGILRAQAKFIFGHIANLAPWWTGLALVNPGATDATVDIYAVAPNGTLIGGSGNIPSARIIIPAGGKTAQLLSELVPQTQLRTSDGGFIYVNSTVPLYGVALFFTRDLRVLSIVPRFELSSDTPFIPPSTR